MCVTNSLQYISVISEASEDLSAFQNNHIHLMYHKGKFTLIIVNFTYDGQTANLSNCAKACTCRCAYV
uniref:Uncharacterized protein n=1 Tax=Anguilla anguilla TaxID=7936 RepID=A0A0E9WCS9_ANGAN